MSKKIILMISGIDANIICTTVSAEVEFFDLYKLEKFTGCISCFACKLPPNEGKCICRDGLAPVLEAIRNADGLILGSPNYLGDVSAYSDVTFKMQLIEEHYCCA